MSKFQHLQQENIEQIGSGINTCDNASELSKETGFDVSGLIKHIKKFRIFKESSISNKCGNRLNCEKTNLCETCYYKKIDGTQKLCCHCKKGCNASCVDFTVFPNCKRIKKFPYVCNGCERIVYCKLSHLTYDPTLVWKKVVSERSKSRRHTQATNDDFIRLSILLKPLILEKKQSLHQIMCKHSEEIGYSYVTILKFIDLKLIPEITNSDLVKRVKYPKKYKKRKNEQTNAQFLKGRTYDDFISYISENPNTDVVEMDTVLSSRDGGKCLLTFLFRKSNFMLAFLLNNKTTDEVKKVFEFIKRTLGLELFKRYFHCILTDNGTEFANPLELEFDMLNGEKLINIFYCDPGKSGQKGKIEKNHVELRKIFPKPYNFNLINQTQLNLALRHVNSEPRFILNRNSPGEVAKAFLDKKILTLNEYSFIEPDNVFLSPKLVK